MEAHISFIDFIKSVNNVGRNKLFEIVLEDRIRNKIMCYYSYFCEDLCYLSDWKPINQRVRQGCPLSPLFTYMYIYNYQRGNHRFTEVLELIKL